MCDGVKGLTSLNISGCPDTSDHSMHKIGQCLKRLKVLKMTNSNVTDMGISGIDNGLSHLEVLDISQSTYVTDSAVEEIADKLIQLKELNVSGCPHLTEQCLETVPLLLPSCRFILSCQHRFHFKTLWSF